MARTERIFARAFLPLLLCLLQAAWSACDSGKGFARAGRIQDFSQLIGGPAALAQPGRDYLIENDKIRAAIQGINRRAFVDFRDQKTEREAASYSVGPGMFGGSLIDLDLQRHGSNFEAGRGNDAISEISPMVNLLSLGPYYDQDYKQGTEGFDPTFPYKTLACQEGDPDYPNCRMTMHVLTSDELEESGYVKDGDLCAGVRVEGAGASILKVLDLLSQLNVLHPIRIRHDYVVCPGEPFVRLVTDVYKIEQEGNPDREEQSTMKPFKGPVNLFDTLIAGMNVDGSNVLGGDLLFFGAKLAQFADGAGYDVSRKMYDTFDQGGETISKPLEMSYFAGRNKGISYAYGHADRDDDGNPGRLLIPIFSGSITTMFTHEKRCPERGSARRACIRQPRLHFERYLTVGKGDVASSLKPLYDLQGRKYGILKGHVLDGNDGRPVSKVDVYVIRKVEGETCEESHWCNDLPEEVRTYEDLVRRNRCFTACASLDDDPPEDCAELLGKGDSECANDPSCSDCEIGDVECVVEKKMRCLNNDTEGNIAFETELLTDVGLENDKVNGYYEGPVPPGTYYLVARKGVGKPSAPFEVTVQEGRTTKADIVLPPTGKLRIEVYDNYGQPIPAKVTIGHCFPECSRDLNDPVTGYNPDCKPGYTCDLEENCRPMGEVNDASMCQDDEELKDGKCVCKPVSGGLPELGDPRLHEKTSEILFVDRGSIEVELPPGGYEVLVNHGFEYSMDRRHVVVKRDRQTQIVSKLNRVVDTTGWIAGDFHIHCMNSYDAKVKLDVRPLQMAAEGMELLSSSDHDFVTSYLRDLRYYHEDNRLAVQVGEEITTLEYGHWLVFPISFDYLAQEHGAVDWQDKPPAQIFYEAHSMGEFERPMVVVAHPRDGFFGYFDQFGLNPFDLRVSPGMLASTNKVVDPVNWSTGFDAVEVFNSKRFEMIRTPTVREIGLFNMALKDIEKRNLTVPQIQTLIRAAGDTVIRQELVRTRAEDRAWYDYKTRLQEARDRVSDWASKPDLLPNCEWFSADSCRSDADCAGSDAGPVCDLWLGQVPDLDGSMITLGNCTKTCDDDADCEGVGQICQSGVCRERGDDPCTKIPNPVDDWFSMLNHGFLRPALGHSDSHTLSKNEAGTPRDWIVSSTDLPAYIDRKEILENMKAGRVTFGYGPFVEIWVNGKPIGSTVEIDTGDEVTVRVRVQSPEWMDVDRVEIYRNGRLHPRWGEWSLSVPNKNVVVFDRTFVDKPDKDSWYVAIAMGTKGKRLDPAHIAKPLPTLTIGMVTSRAFANIKGIPIDAFYKPGPFEPSVFGIYPYSMTNAVFVDVGKDGWQAPEGKGPGWETQPDGPGSSD